MGIRFRRTIKVLPGIRLNLSRSGVSTSVGVRGAHVTVGHGKVRETVGAPGTGIYYTTTQQTRGDRADEAQAPDGDQAMAKLGRVVRIVVLGILAAFALGVVVLWALATFLR